MTEDGDITGEDEGGGEPDPTDRLTAPNTPDDGEGLALPPDDDPDGLGHPLGGEPSDDSKLSDDESKTLRDLMREVIEDRRRVIAQRDAARDEARRRIVAERADQAPSRHIPLDQRPTVQLGAYAWALIGMAIMLVVTGLIIALLSPVVVPLVIALFPAAVLTPMVNQLRKRGLPSPLAAMIVLIGALGVIGGIGAFIAPAVADQVGDLSASISDGYSQVERFLASGPFGLEPIRMDEVVDQLSESLSGGVGSAAGNALGVAVRFFEGATTILLTLIVLFFYLKDGRAIGQWVRSLFPQRLRKDVDAVGDMVWRTIGGYIQGQLIVALVDAVFIGIGLVILRVPLALPLALIVFFGGLFPVVGASIAGFLAMLVALASNGLAGAGLVILLIVGVQALEGNLLQPLILGRALELHPLAIVVSLAVGGFLLGILGAFLAVPVAAASAQTVAYVRRRVPG